MSDYTLFPIAFLYTNNRNAIEGATRFQKLIFLAQEETNLPDIYSFHADKYGPFSPEAHSDIHALVEAGYIERDRVTNEVGNTKYVFSITTEGVRKAKSMIEQDGSGSLFGPVEKIKETYNDKPLNELLQYVYTRYDEFTVETELDLDRLFDPDARSEFLEPSIDRDFAGTKPGEWKTLNPSADEFFSTK